MNTKAKISLFGAIVLLIAQSGFSQRVNKVENFSFEKVTEKIKEPGLLNEEEYVVEWEPPRNCPPADIFSTEARKDEVMAPANKFGSQSPQEGNTYAGLLLYSEREAEPRMYIQSRLDDKLIAGKKYCVKFHLSLADLSKYAINSIGAHISDSKVKLDDFEEEGIKPQIIKSDNAIIKEMQLWVPVCTEYQANGNERYITIGNFEKQDNVLTEKMRRPREYREPQLRGGYYYIDNISVIASSHLEEPCICEEQDDDDGRLEVRYTKNVSDDMEMSPEKQIGLNKLFFENGRFNLTENHKATLNRIAGLMQKDDAVTVEVVGHADEQEDKMYSFDISDKRATAVFNYLIEQGAPESRLKKVALQSTKPDATGGTSQARAQNRRVEFKASK